jgi:uncharacterized membrane protein
LQALSFALETFGPLLAYALGQWRGGPIAGIAAASLWAAVDVAQRVLRKRSTSRLFWFTTLLTLGFGAFDLVVGKVVLFRFEAVVTNLLTALYFGGSIITGKSLVEEFYERSRASVADPPRELTSYLRLFTGVWAVYFLLKSAVYCWLALTLPLARLVLIRSTVGTLSLLLLLGGERLVRARLFRYLKERGYLARGA